VPLLLYLSCNPTTLARDLKGLLKGYELRDLRVYDFFPHTPHIETLAILEERRTLLTSR
jgi:tRNA/tmRNA/rRNA uracil-C5-methylase (TrmA/RlmC/RlmD family)